MKARISIVSPEVVQCVASRMLDPMHPLMGYFAHTGAIEQFPVSSLHLGRGVFWGRFESGVGTGDAGCLLCPRPRGDVPVCADNGTPGCGETEGHGPSGCDKPGPCCGGAPCHGCGAPRWTFAHDPELGEFCGQCGWPLPAEALDATRRQKSVEELRGETAALRAQIAEHTTTIATRDREIAAMQGRLDRVQRTATGLHRQQRAARFRGPIDATAVPTSIPADATIEELQDQARQALALAQAGRDRVDQIAVEIARRAAE